MIRGSLCHLERLLLGEDPLPHSAPTYHFLGCGAALLTCSPCGVSPATSAGCRTPLSIGTVVSFRGGKLAW